MLRLDAGLGDRFGEKLVQRPLVFAGRAAAAELVSFQQKPLPRGQQLVLEHDRVGVHHLLALLDVLDGHDDRGGAYVGPVRVGRAGVVQQRQGGVDGTADGPGLDTLVGIPLDGFGNLVRVKLKNLEKI